MADFLKIRETDNLAVALKMIPAGTEYQGIHARIEIPQGHKMALTPIREGEAIIKYDYPIGHATCDIRPGDWIHTHNMATNLSGTEEYVYDPIGDRSASSLSTSQNIDSKSAPLTFQGFRRPDGKVGIRNEIWILPLVGCVNDVAKALTSQNQDLLTGSVEGIYAYTHPFGCSQTGGDHANTRKLLAALARHPNAGAVLILSLGCENLTQEQFREELGDYDANRVKFLVCQEVEDEFEAGRKLLAECASYAATFVREEISASELIVGMKCGGSDGLSGITANPLVGRFSDLLISQGGSTVLTEVPEMFGAEGMLLPRCRNEEVFDKAVAMLNGFKEYFLSHGENVYENPSPGNKAGGITTLEDKSCGCVQKGGMAIIEDVISYGEAVTKKGLTLLDGPGNDLVSSTALTAAGAHLILFTTGRGTPFGAPAPTMKIATNTPLAEKKAGWIDFNAGVIADGISNLQESANDLMHFVLEIASGRKTKAEEKGFREISIFKGGVVL